MTLEAAAALSSTFASIAAAPEAERVTEAITFVCALVTWKASASIPAAAASLAGSAADLAASASVSASASWYSKIRSDWEALPPIAPSARRTRRLLREVVTVATHEAWPSHARASSARAALWLREAATATATVSMTAMEEGTPVPKAAAAATQEVSCATVALVLEAFAMVTAVVTV